MWFLFKAAGILCLFTNILISSLTFCAASMLGRYKLYLCRSGLGLCSFGDRWLWCATKPKVAQKSNQLFTFCLCSQSIVVKSARVGVCWRGRGGVLQLYIVYSIIWYSTKYRCLERKRWYLAAIKGQSTSLLPIRCLLHLCLILLLFKFSSLSFFYLFPLFFLSSRTDSLSWSKQGCSLPRAAE